MSVIIIINSQKARTAIEKLFKASATMSPIQVKEADTILEDFCKDVDSFLDGVEKLK